jgi:predicted DNA-binding transcriptional regulator AlpA
MTKLIRRTEVARRYGVHAVTVTRWATDPKYAGLNFPKPISMGPGTECVLFDEAEIEADLAARKAARDAPKAA